MEIGRRGQAYFHLCHTITRRTPIIGCLENGQKSYVERWLPLNKDGLEVNMGADILIALRRALHGVKRVACPFAGY